MKNFFYRLESKEVLDLALIILKIFTLLIEMIQQIIDIPRNGALPLEVIRQLSKIRSILKTDSQYCEKR